MLNALSISAHVVVTPHHCEFGTLARELIDHVLAAFRRARSGCLRPESRHHEARGSLPIRLRRANLRIAEDKPQDVALLWREFVIIGKR